MSHEAQRHAAITGGGRGIGRAIALRLASEGFRVSICGRSPEPLAATAEDLLEAGCPGVFHFPCDIRDRGAVDAWFVAATEVNGPLTGLVANSGVGGANSPGPQDRWVEILDTNLTGTYWCCRAAQRHLAPGPQPRNLLLLSSILGRFGVPGYTAYCASKAGLLGLTKALAMELAPQGVQVNALCPGWVDTEMARNGIEGMAEAMGVSYEEARARAVKVVPLGRMSTPEEIASVAAFLLGDGSRGITGQGIDVNNGAWMG